MAIKLAIYEVCKKCGEIDARIEGEWVRYGIHDCRLAEPLAGPPRPKWAGSAPLAKIRFVPADLDSETGCADDKLPGTADDWRKPLQQS